MAKLPAQDIVERLRDHAPKRICIEVDGYDPGPQFHTHWVLPGKNTERQVEYIRADFIEAQVAATISRLTADNEALRAEIERMTPKFVAYEYLEAPERQLAEARAERDTLAMHLEAKAILAKRDNARLREALRETDCPRPCNHRPDDFSAGDCFDAGECGCGVRAALAGKE